MRKKLVALFLSAAMIAASAVPAVAAAEFSDGETAVENNYGERSIVDDIRGNELFADVVDSADESVFGDNANADASGVTEFGAVETELPVLGDAEAPMLDEVTGVDVAAAEDKLYTINFKARIILDQTEDFVDRLNAERKKLGRVPLKIDQRLMEKAIKRAPEVAILFDHVNPVTGRFVNEKSESEIPFIECISLSFFKEENTNTAGMFVLNFKDSTPHWNALMSPYCTRIGAAIIEVPQGFDEGGPFLHFMIACPFSEDPEDGFYNKEETVKYIPYTSGFKNLPKQAYTQQICSKFYGGLCYNDKTWHRLHVGDTKNIKPYLYNNSFYGEGGCILEIDSMPGGFWKSMTPKTMSVDQNGKITALAPGDGIVRYYLEDGSDDYSERCYTILESPAKPTPIPITKKPSAPKLTAALSGYTNAKLTWNKTSNTKGYQVYRYNSKTKKYDRIKTLKGTSATSYTDSVGYAKEAKYKVRAYNTGSDGKNVYGSYSSVKNVKTAAATPVITGISNSTKTKLKITWKKAPGAEGYQIYRRVGKTGSYKRVKTLTSGSTTSYTNGSLKKGTTYYYKVRAFRKGADGKTICGKWSKVVYKTSR